MAVSCNTCLGVNDCVPCFGQTIKQSRFSDIWSSHYCQYVSHCSIVDMCLQRYKNKPTQTPIPVLCKKIGDFISPEHSFEKVLFRKQDALWRLGTSYVGLIEIEWQKRSFFLRFVHSFPHSLRLIIGLSNFFLVDNPVFGKTKWRFISSK